MSFVRKALKLCTEWCGLQALVEQFDPGGDGMANATVWYGRLVWG